MYEIYKNEIKFDTEGRKRLVSASNRGYIPCEVICSGSFKKMWWIRIYKYQHDSKSWPRLFKGWQERMRLDNAIHRINLYPVDSTIIFPNTNPLDSDLFSGQRYPTFEQLGPGEHKQSKPMVFC